VIGAALRIESQTRQRIFQIGWLLLALNAVFFALWQRVGLRFAACHGEAVGIEVGLVSTLIVLPLALFGRGWARIGVVLAALAVSYLWLSWIAWIVQMKC
jgi:hypothetical protein